MYYKLLKLHSCFCSTGHCCRRRTTGFTCPERSRRGDRRFAFSPAAALLADTQLHSCREKFHHRIPIAHGALPGHAKDLRTSNLTLTSCCSFFDSLFWVRDYKEGVKGQWRSKATSVCTTFDPEGIQISGQWTHPDKVNGYG